MYFNVRNILPKSGTFPRDTLYLMITKSNLVRTYNILERERILVMEENCALLGYYAASSGNLLPTFRDKPKRP